MEAKDILNGNEIMDLEQLSKVAGGVNTETGEVHPLDRILGQALIRNYKGHGYTMEKTLEELRESQLPQGKKVLYDAIIREDWKNC